MAIIDLRSDTVTQPSPNMRRAMAEAVVGDDVYGEDPTVHQLEAKVAELYGKEAALFFPSGTMANQVAIRAHTEPGDEVVLEAMGHSYAYESGAMAALSGVQARPVKAKDGILEAAEVERAINASNPHFARTRLVVVENTSNRGGGTLYRLDRLDAIADVVDRHELILHVDGARLMNASVALGVPAAALVRRAASATLCLSKGLGAPVGSVLAGSKPFIARAHRFRKMFGGGMRQAGILAAAGLYALEHNVARLAEDHQNQSFLSRGLAEIRGLRIDPARYPTNICYAEVEGRPAPAVVEAFKAAGVLANATSPTEIRFVTHLNLSRADIEEALTRIRRVMSA
ncbi:MAG: low-specificity L-threonine aldolase [Myxococcota bacterium]